MDRAAGAGSPHGLARCRSKVAKPWTSPKLRAAGAVALFALAGGTAVLSALAAWQLANPLRVSLLPFIETPLARERALLSIPNPDRPSLSAALAQAELARARAPMRTATWLAESYAEVRLDGRMSSQVQADLQRSYAIAPLDPDVGPGRLRLALEFWDELKPDLRREALLEIDALWGRCASAPLAALGYEIHNPSGRMALIAEITTSELAWMRIHAKGQAQTELANGNVEAWRCRR